MSDSAGRAGAVDRTTTETKVSVKLDLSRPAIPEGIIDTGVPFFDHMLHQVARHAAIALDVRAAGDLEIDAHHTVEDVGISIGEALIQALGDKRGIARYGDAVVPMEEALAQVALDISGRPLLAYDADVPAESIGQYDIALTEEFFTALCRAGGLTMHVKLLAGRNAHHCIEAIFKAFARALRAATDIDPRAGDVVPSTKGRL
ncbi:MAG TPA: imidazoleglycerol-phosphate dehydratase HisB [Actinomycetota bacterium]|nr:imidazoleglycerol-phosphate dehydratase HisB [Actinomycetota bacterium]